MSKKDHSKDETATVGNPIVEGNEQNEALSTNLSSDQGVANENANTANRKADDDDNEPETLTAEELALWSKQRFLAGQAEAAANVQKRYEKLIRKDNPGRNVIFSRNPENGDLMYEVGKTESEIKQEEEAKKEAARKEAESKKRIEDAQRREDEKARGVRR